jgi:endonuclease-3
LRYSFHVDCIAHGRAVCRARRPDCESCCIRQFCDHYQKGTPV